MINVFYVESNVINQHNLHGFAHCWC